MDTGDMLLLTKHQYDNNANIIFDHEIEMILHHIYHFSYFYLMSYRYLHIGLMRIYIDIVLNYIIAHVKVFHCT